jgi:hypothetical protein
MKNTRKKRKEKKRKELKLNRRHRRYETYIHKNESGTFPKLPVKKANRSNVKCLILCIKNTRIQILSEKRFLGTYLCYPVIEKVF